MRLIDANRIVYSWQIDADGQEHDGVTLQSIIDKIPTIEPQQQWIPCSERLPEEDNVEVLCTVKQQSKTDRSETIIVEQGCYFYGTWLLSYDNKRVNCIREVLAWQPLPSPYQPKEDES